MAGLSRKNILIEFVPSVPAMENLFNYHITHNRLDPVVRKYYLELGQWKIDLFFTCKFLYNGENLIIALDACLRWLVIKGDWI